MATNKTRSDKKHDDPKDSAVNPAAAANASPEQSGAPHPLQTLREAEERNDSGVFVGENAHDQGEINAAQSQLAEHQLKTQQNKQNERDAFQKGNAQEHQQGNRQK